MAIFLEYLTWHFFEMPKNIFLGIKNFLFFGLNYFSIPLLFKTLFSPWRQYRWVSSTRGLDIGVWFEARFSNLISRTIGAIMRIILILIGLFVEVFFLIGGIIIFFDWLVLPILSIFGLYHGFRILL